MYNLLCFVASPTLWTFAIMVNFNVFKLHGVLYSDLLLPIHSGVIQLAVTKDQSWLILHCC